MLGQLISVLRSCRRRLESALRTVEIRCVADVGRSVFSGEAEVHSRRERSAIQIGDNCHIRGELLVFRHSGQIRIGNWVYIGPRSSLWSSSESGITIGNRVLISMNVHIHDTDGHPVDAEARFHQTQSILCRGHPAKISDITAYPIHIGDDAWIGNGAIILKGVSIGEGAIVGAMSVVTHDVPAKCIVAGNPARIIRFLNEPKNTLEAIQIESGENNEIAEQKSQALRSENC